MTTGNNKQRILEDEIHQTNIEQALTRYEQARMDGLCHEGALEVALSILQAHDREALIARLEKERGL